VQSFKPSTITWWFGVTTDIVKIFDAARSASGKPSVTSTSISKKYVFGKL
jgi:hypothetical protein